MRILTGLLVAATAFAASVTYSYDAAGRLLSATYDNGVVVTYTYDKAGNLLGREVTAEDVAQAFLHHALALKTTADVTTVDGGNIAAILR